MSVTGQFDMVGGATRYGKFSDFLGLGQDSNVACDGWTGVTENSGTSTVATAVIDGAYTLTTGTSDNNAGSIVLGLNYRASDNGIVMEAGVNLTSIASVGLFVGFTDTTSIEFPISISGTTITSTATDAVGLLFDTDATTDVWYAVGVKADVDTAAIAVSSAYTPVAATYQNIRVQVDTNGYAYFFINGNQVAMQNLNQGTGQTGLANAVTTTAALTPCVYVGTRTTAAKVATVDYVYAQKGRI